MKCEHCGHRIPQTIGERIQAARRDKRITRARLEAVIGAGTGNVTRWESGTRTPCTDTLVRLGAQLGVSMDWLLTGRGAH